MHAATYLKLNFLDPSSLGTGMTGEGGYLDDEKRATWMTSSLVDSNHNVRTVVCFDTGILN
ncbi:hypothetical protein EUZ93_04080 [Wolbachia pipientis]|nr:hypothetical protein [Wolbachia pipientis]